MEFDEVLVKLQGALNSSKNIHGLLNDICAVSDKKKLNDIIEKLSVVVNAESADKAKHEMHLRKVTLYLILNADISIQEELIKNEDYGHLVCTCPTLGKELLLCIICNMGLQQYLYEVIAHGNSDLAIELIEATAITQKFIDPHKYLELMSGTFKAAYQKLLKLAEKGDITKESEVHMCIITNYLKSFLGFFLKPDPKFCDGMNVKDMFYFAGCAFKTLLLTIDFCFNLYLNSPEQEDEIYSLYNITLDVTCSKCKCDEGHKVSFLNLVNEEMLKMFRCNTIGITFDIWIYWVECDQRNGRNLQTDIGEASYVLADTIKCMQKTGFSIDIMNEVLELLSKISIKPLNEDDEIKSSDFKTIMHNISNQEKTQWKWWKAFLAYDLLCDTEETVECLDKNLPLADIPDILRILDIIYHKLISSENLDAVVCERLKQIAINAVRNPIVPSQVKILQSFFSKYGVTSVMETRNFKQDCTQLFNKFVDACGDDEEEKFLKESILLCLQSAEYFTIKALSEVLGNTKQLPSIVRILKALESPLSALSKEGTDLILYSFNKVVENRMLDDIERKNYVEVIRVFINESIIHEKKYAETCLFPCLHKAADTRDWSNLLLWLQTLSVFVGETVNQSRVFCKPVIFIMLAQLLEASKWNVFTYTPKAVLVREEILSIINILLKDNINEDEWEGISASYLQNKLEQILSPLNKHYFKKLWVDVTDRNCPTAQGDLQTELVEGILSSNDSVITDLIKEHTGREEIFLKVGLWKVLPSLTFKEWVSVANGIKRTAGNLNMQSNPVIIMTSIFTDVILCISSVILKKIDAEDNLAILSLFLKNLGMLLMEEEVPLAFSTVDPELSVTIFQKLLFIVERLPHQIKNAVSSVWIGLFVELVIAIWNRCQQEQQSSRDLIIRKLVTSISIVTLSELRQAMAKKLFHMSQNMCQI